MKNLPVLHIGQFNAAGEGKGFYTETLQRHLQDHLITARPHRHDFFLAVLFTKGKGVHEVDFTKYAVKPGALFLLSPGQSHHWTLSADVEGYIFFHTREFFDKRFTGQCLQDFPFFGSIYHPPVVQLPKKALEAALSVFLSILREYKATAAMKQEKLASLVNLLYIDLLRVYTLSVPVKSGLYLARLRQFEQLLDMQFRTLKSPSRYAEEMRITERHLNRICRTCLGKTPTDLIHDRSMLEAKRLLMGNDPVIAGIAGELGYADASYFSRLFKKKTGQTPKAFLNSYDRKSG